MRYSYSVITLILGLVFLISCSKSDDVANKKVVIKFGHLANEQHVWHKAALFFAEEVKNKSAGKIEVKVFPSEQLGKELDMITGILAGTVDMTISGESMQNWASKTALCAVPYLIRDSEHLAQVVDGAIGKEIEQEMIGKVGLRPLTWFERGARNLTSNRPIRHPDDLNSIILRVPNVPLYVNVWQALGAKPTPMAFSEVFTSLQQNTIQAQENPYALIKSAGFYEVQKYCNLTEHVIGWVYVIMGEQKFKNLPPDLQKIIIEAGQAMKLEHQKLFIEDQQQLVSELKQKGMTFVEVDKAAFQEKARETVISSLSAEQKILFDKINALSNK